MSNLYGTAIYKKNVSTAERVVRLALSAAVVVVAALWIGPTAARWAVIAAGAMFSLTGVLGFCPACYLAGRKSPA